MEHGVMHTNSHVDPQDMTNMGDLRKKMPVTFWTFLIGGFALSGFPLITAGFWSKDEILADAFGHGHLLVFVVLAISALLTAFYTMRQITMTFLSPARTEAAKHASETPWTMTLPLSILAVFALGAGWVGIPEHFPVLGGLIPNWFHEFVGSTLHEHPEVLPFNVIPLMTSIGVASLGLLGGWLVYRNYKNGEVDPLAKLLGPVHTLLKNKYYIDELYSAALIKPAIWLSEVFATKWIDQGLIDGVLHTVAMTVAPVGSFLRNKFDIPIINGLIGDSTANLTREAGKAMRPIQTGRIQNYMFMALFGLALISGVFLVIMRVIP
jgi:NADH-quinone oxidoreductase subunit L